MASFSGDLTLPAVTLSAPFEGQFQYASLDYATEFLETVVNTAPWDDATIEERRKALREASRRIDRLNFKGIRKSETQPGQFPRDDDTEFPADIKRACVLIALALLDGIDPELEHENQFMTGHGYASIRGAYDRSSRPEHILAGIPSFEAWTYLRPYLRDPRTFQTQRSS